MCVCLKWDTSGNINAIIVIKMLIFSVESRLLFSLYSLMSASLKGGKKTIINTGDFVDIWIYDIAVLHRECGSSGKTNKLMFARCCGFHMCACISYHLLAFSSPIVPFVYIWVQWVV